MDLLVPYRYFIHDRYIVHASGEKGLRGQAGARPPADSEIPLLPFRGAPVGRDRTAQHFVAGDFVL